MGKNLYKDGFTDFDYFGRLDYTFFTLMQILTLDWAGVVRSVIVEYPWAWAPFLIFICITCFIVFNLIVAVICDSVSLLYVHEHEKEAEEEEEEKCPGLRNRARQIKMNLNRLDESQEEI